MFIAHVLNLQDRAVLCEISQNLHHSIPDHCENTSDVKITFLFRSGMSQSARFSSRVIAWYSDSSMKVLNSQSLTALCLVKLVIGL